MADAFSLPTSASSWMFKDLDQLKIVYDEAPTELKDFMFMLKNRHDQPKLANINLSEEQKRLLYITKTYWKLSFDFDIRRTGGKRKTRMVKDEQRRKIDAGIKEAKDFLKELRDEDSEVCSELKRSRDFISSGMLYRWKSNLVDFMTFYLDILKRWDYPSQREGKFTYLFMLFSKICLLRPEPGDTYAETLSINSITVTEIPDVRFIAHHNSKVVAVTEVKKENDFKIRELEEDSVYDEIIKQQVAENALGQLGGELLLEKSKSVFKSGVAGVLCLGTKVFITFLDIEDDHYSKIQESKADENDEAIIYYTKGFDFMKADDRKDLLEVLFWFAELQHNTEI